MTLFLLIAPKKSCHNEINSQSLTLVKKIQWNPAITKCHGTEKNVRYSGVFVIAKTPL